MTVLDLDDIRRKWEADKPAYEVFGKFVVGQISSACARVQIPVVTVCYRTKDTASLLKKVLGRNLPYEQMSDRVGARVVPAFRSDVDRVAAEIARAFTIVKSDIKSASLGTDRMGYLADHYDVTHPDHPGLQCEVQVRSVHEDAWANASHVIAYKPGRELPGSLRRQVNLLSSLVEVADVQFDNIRKFIDELPDAEPVRLATLLEDLFLSLVGTRYDEALTFQTVALLLPALKELPDGPVRYLRDFVEKNREALSSVYRKHLLEVSAPQYLFLSQPESIAIFALIEKRRFQTTDLWQEKYPLQMLVDMADLWGVPLHLSSL